MSTLIKGSPHISSTHPPTGETDQVPPPTPCQSPGALPRFLVLSHPSCDRPTVSVPAPPARSGTDIHRSFGGGRRTDHQFSPTSKNFHYNARGWHILPSYSRYRLKDPHFLHRGSQLPITLHYRKFGRG